MLLVAFLFHQKNDNTILRKHLGLSTMLSTDSKIHLNVATAHLETYNHFVVHEIPQIVRELYVPPSGTEGHDIRFENIWVPPATMSPKTCRDSNQTYSTPVFASVIERRNGQLNVVNRVIIAHVPVMTRSVTCYLYGKTTEERVALGECEKDCGGYFIVNGIERVLVTQIRNMYNHVQVFKESNGGKGTVIARVRSISEETSHSVVVEACITHDTFTFTLPYTRSPVSGVHILQLCGLSSAQEAWAVIADVGTEQHRALLNKLYREAPSEPYEAIYNVVNRVVLGADPESVAKQIVFTDMFPHLGSRVPETVWRDYTISFIRKLIVANPDDGDRDNLRFKRFETSGILLYELYKNLFKHFMNMIPDIFRKNAGVIDISNRMDLFIRKNINYCMATGKWGLLKNAYVRQGVCQLLNRLSYIGTLSHLQRVTVPVGKEGKNVKIRQIHPSHFGFLCLYETPEGASCGVVMNTTVLCKVSLHHSALFIANTIRSLIPEVEPQHVSVFINDIPLLHTNNADQFMAQVRHQREEGRLPQDISVYPENGDVYVYSDRGRIIRPLVSFKTGKIVWLDAAEIQHTTVAMFPAENVEARPFQYHEIHPSLMFGIGAGVIPYSNHNQSPRNVYEASMIKQALGFFATNIPIRTDTTFHTLAYPQKALVTTMIGRSIGVHDMPAGINCVVAILTHGSWNAEDSVILNRGAVERGLFMSFTYHTVTVEENKTKTESLKEFRCPPLALMNPDYNYDKLDENGIIRRGVAVQKGDVLIGRVQETATGERDCSEVSEDEGFIDRINMHTVHNGHRIAKVVIRKPKFPEMGDKFANQAAQKGTCGLIRDQEDMPFSPDGITPDIIVNPNALPSRMTISMLLEMVTGKQCCKNGRFGDGTPFTKSGEDIIQALKDEGNFEDMGWEQLTDGTTGRPLRCKTFMGTSYYQKLKHMVSEKIHARSYGNITTLTRQPLAGRSKEGGLRFGEMERDGILSHGSVQFLKERLFDMSDMFHVLICNDCGLVSNHKRECHNCKNADLYKTNIPYAGKLLFQQLDACLIHPIFHAELQ